MLVSERIGQFFVDAGSGRDRLEYTEYGAGRHWVVLIHGQLMPRRMHQPLARALAAEGLHVVTLDLLGHGRSDRPADPLVYSMSAFADQVVALLDHLGAERAVIGGTSLGANVSLEVAAESPDRVQGLIVEMPVLDNALLGCAIAFTPLMCALTFGEPVMKGVSWVTRKVPTGRVWGADVLLDTVRQQPGPSAAVLQGLFFGRVAPHREIRRKITAPALVIGHDRDPVHPFSDSDALVCELPNARLLRADSLLELRLTPERLTGEISGFLDECWRPRRKTGGRRAAGVA
jgi:pimeloyl-ACP methyl ester carboxylesterase